MKHNTKVDDVLKVELVEEKIVISIGVETLAFAVECGLDWPPDYVIDPGQDKKYEAFGKSILQVLNSEEEDGTTPIHRMFDSVAMEALDQGYEGFEEAEIDNDD